MTTILSTMSRRLVPLAAVSALLLTACTIGKQSAPGLSGPSAAAMQLNITASPVSLPRDGASMSTIAISATDFTGKPVANQRLVLSTTAGTLSETEVTTNGSGGATVQFTAASLNTPVNSAQITAQPVELNNTSPNSIARSVTVLLNGPAVPSASFTTSPQSPGQFDLVTFDASATKIDGAACASTCTYTWDFGDGSSGTGKIATHRYSSQGTFVVTLTVTAPGGTSSTQTATVTVGAAKSITANFTISPTDPALNQTVYFDASSSTTPDGTAITNYAWDFGNGLTQTGSSATAQTTYSTAHTYTVQLTITDALGRTATKSATVTAK